MNRRTLLTIIGVIVAIVAIGLFLFSRYLQDLTAPKPLTISYATVRTTMPEGAPCAGGGGEMAIAKEIFNLESDDIYIAGGSNPMPDDVWTNYGFRLPLLKNTTRNLLFGPSCFFRSPDAAANCVGEACFTVEELVGYTWLKLTTVAGNDCYPDPSGCSGDQVKPGYVSINTIAKCHQIVFNGPTVYELADGQGNRYIMHATADGQPKTAEPALPDGWTLTAQTISEPLVLLPFGGGDQCYYNVVRDNLVQSYHQVAYAQAQYPPQD
jgi:hypothetical protein